MERELPLRITVLRPPPGVRFALQSGRSELVEPVRTGEDSLVFDFKVRVGERPDGAPNFLGPFAQGTPADRFVYVSSGVRAGQVDSCWDQRAKVPLTTITRELIQEAAATPGARLEARIEGTGRDGGPTCATVPRPEREWRVARD